MSSMSPQEEWGLHKNTIHRLYIVEDRPLKEVMATLRGKAFAKQQLKTWGFSKNLPSGEWKAIGHKVEKRKRENKDSDVVASGIRYPPAKVRKETSRHFYNTQEKLQHEAMSPETHSAVTVCTPAPMDMSFPWPSSLPWLQLTEFAPVFRPGQLSAFPGLAICTQEAPDGNLREGVPQETTIEQAKLLPFVLRTQGFSNLDSSSYNVSTIAAELGKVMPESFEGEHFLTSHLILKERGTISASILLRILAYRFSNNLIGTDDNGVLDFIRRSGIIDLDILTKDFFLAQPSISAFFEKVFEQAIDTGQADIVMKALNLGKNPSAVFRNPSLTCVLLAQNVEIVASTLISELRQRAPMPHAPHLDHVLEMVCESDDPRVLEILLRHGLDPNLKFWDNPLLSHILAPIPERLVMAEMLLLAGAEVQLKLVVEELLLLGVNVDERAVVDHRASFDSSVIVHNKEQELTALELAVERGMFDAVTLLLRFGATVTEDALRLAVKLGNRSIVLILVEQGAPITDSVFETALETFYAVPTAPSISRYLAMITGSSDIQLGSSRHTLVIKQAAINMSRTLFAAVQSNDHLLISDLVGTELSCPVHPPDDGYSILRDAILKDQYWTVDLFLEAYPIAYDPISLLNAVAKFIHTPWREKQLEIAKKLLDRRPPGTHPNRLEATAINMAVSLAEERDHTLLDLMLNLVEETETWGYHPGCVDLGPRLCYHPILRPACAIAAKSGHTRLLEKLLQAGYKPPNVNAPGAKYGGRTALEGAAEHGRLDLIQLLLEEGALVEGIGRKQFIHAVGYASKQGHQVLANLLKSQGGWSEIDEHALVQEDLTDPEPGTVIQYLPHIVTDEDDYESCDEPAGDFESDEDE
ncbi:hypothetical protein DL767_003577 [Monosporascus sp. MG133]|nr:hypothetical protein DL767_003577 [Monosporascus sp. MG133]